MAATKQDISRWLDSAKKDGKTHVLVVCDTYDWDDYPVYVGVDEDVKTIESQYNGKNMQKVMEVYNLSMDKEEQMNESRAFNY